MIASEDVRRVTFERAMRGYRCEDVDDYLKQVADSMDALAAENEDLQKKLVVLAQRIDQYRAEEDTLRTTMINAQRLGENVIKEAKQKAAETIRAATIKAEDREQHARDEVELAKQELITLKKEPAPYTEPAPEPVYAEPDQEPEAEAPAAVPEPEYAEPEYYEEQPAEGGQRISTVEFAIAPKADTPEEKPAPAQEALPDASALFEQPAAAPKKSPRSRGGTTAKKTGTRKKAQPPQEDLPAAFDSFQGVDYND